MAGDEPPSVRLCANHRYESMRESEVNTLVGSVSSVDSLLASKRGSTAAPLLCSLWPVGPLTPRAPRVSDPYLGFW